MKRLDHVAALALALIPFPVVSAPIYQSATAFHAIYIEP